MAYKFTPETRKKVIDALRSGATQRLAAEYAGIHRDTLADWLKQAEKDGEDSEFWDFYTEYHQARGQQAKQLLERIRTIGDTINSWQAHAWILEHSFPKDYGRSIFGGDPNETPEIRHIVEIVRGDSAPTIIEGAGTPPEYQIAERVRQDAQDPIDGDITVEMSE